MGAVSVMGEGTRRDKPSAAIRHEIVLHRIASAVYTPSFVSEGGVEAYLLAEQLWRDMGEPETITVTVEPGDTLNGPDPTEGLPADLVRVMRDPRLVVPRDHEVRLADGRTLHEHLEEWRNAPSETASGFVEGVGGNVHATEAQAQAFRRGYEKGAYSGD